MSQKQVLAPIVGRTLVLPDDGCPETTRWERLTATIAPGIATPVTTIKPSLMPCAVIQASPLSVVPVAWRVPPVLAAPQTPGIAEIAATSTEGLGEHHVGALGGAAQSWTRQAPARKTQKRLLVVGEGPDVRLRLALHR